MSDAGQPTVTSFRVGRVIVRTFSAFFANILAFIPLTVVAGLPMLLVGLLIPEGTVTLHTNNFADFMQAVGPVLWIVLLVVIVSIGGYCWISAGITYGVVAHLRGRKAGWKEILVQSFAAVPRLVLLALLVAVAFMVAALINFIPILGTLVFLFGGLWLFVIYWVTIPATVVERLGPLASLKRSAQLTKGHRWAVLGAIVLWVIVSWVAMILLAIVLGLVGAALGGGYGSSVLGALLGVVMQALSMGLGASVAAVGYHDLRVTKEGVGTEEIARVFD